jgi:hypothetical protein
VIFFPFLYREILGRFCWVNTLLTLLAGDGGGVVWSGMDRNFFFFFFWWVGGQLTEGVGMCEILGQEKVVR